VELARDLELHGHFGVELLIDLFHGGPGLQVDAGDVGHALDGRQECRVFRGLRQDLVELSLSLLALGQLRQILVIGVLRLARVGQALPQRRFLGLRAANRAGYVAVEYYEVGQRRDEDDRPPHADLAGERELGEGKAALCCCHGQYLTFACS
jgi:hypothetical protein